MSRIDRAPPPPQPPNHISHPPPPRPDYDPDAIATRLGQSPLVHQVGIAFVFLLLVAAALLSLMKVDRIVNAPGRVVAVDPPIVHRSVERAPVLSVAVRPGDRVRKGDSLAVLDTTRADAELAHAQTRIEAAHARLAGARAAISGGPMPRGAGEAWAIEAELLQTLRDRQTAQAQGFDARIHQADITEQAASRTLNILGEQLRRDTETLATLLAGLQQRVVARERVEAVQQRLTATSSEIAETERKRETAIRERDRVEAERREADAALGVQLAQGLATALREQAEALRDLELAENTARTFALLAKVDGIVVETGEIGTPTGTEVLVKVVPIGPDGMPRVRVHLDLDAEDAGWVRPGHLVRVKIASLPHQRHGSAVGRVVTLSPDAVPRETTPPRRAAGREAGRVQRAYVDIESLNGLREVPPGFMMRPGLELEGGVHIGRRTIMGYILDLRGSFLEGALAER